MRSLRVSKIDRIRNYIFRIIRGKFKQVGSNIKGVLLCGKAVQMKHRKYVHCDGKLVLGDYVEIDGFSKEGIQIGGNSTIGKYSIMRASSFYTSPGEGIKIGCNFCCGDFSFFGASGGISIGNDVQIGQAVRFHAQNHKYNGTELIRLQGVENKRIVIGDNCWIGSGTVILAGVEIASGCVIGANSVVTKSFPENCVIAGNPAKVIKQRIAMVE